MLKNTLFQFVITISISFIGGVIATRYVDVEAALPALLKIDPRIDLLTLNFQSTVVPLAFSIVIVLLFSTHPVLYFIAPLFIALKSALFGFSSIVILEKASSISAYVIWWFPFQLLYIIVMIVMYKICRLQRLKRNKKYYHLLPVVLLILAVVSYAEFVVISYVLL